MGGDRDGNPNVTAAVTREVLLLARWMAADLYLRDVDHLAAELSMQQASEELKAKAGDSAEPYRAVLKQLRERLRATRSWAHTALSTPTPAPADVLQDNRDLLDPLELCYHSLHECGMGVIADGPLLDCLRRAVTFGLFLVRLDVRQDSSRHTAAMTEITDYLGLGRYEDWSEEERIVFLTRELNNRRPLLPAYYKPSADTAEVLATCREIAAAPGASLGSYVISMAGAASDVLAVQLLLKESGVLRPMRVVPLFETLADLDNAGPGDREAVAAAGLSLAPARPAGSNDRLFRLGQGRRDHGGRLGPVPGAGTTGGYLPLAQRGAAVVPWSRRHRGEWWRPGARGDSVAAAGFSRRALPHHRAGEMIRFKFGLPDIAEQNLNLYLAAVLEATLLPPPPPTPEWRHLMDELAADGVSAYRAGGAGKSAVRGVLPPVHPEQELGRLPLGSRPAKRRAGGIESLRAIPWIFGWTNTVDAAGLAGLGSGPEQGAGAR